MLRRFWIPPGCIEGQTARLPQDVARHVRTVCRFGPGDRIELLTGDGHAYEAEIRASDKRGVTAAVLAARPLPPPRKPWLRLVLALPRPQTADEIVARAVELGVRAIQLVTSDHSFVRNPTEASEKRERWLRLVRAASAQCGRGDLMAVDPPSSLSAVLDQWSAGGRRAGLFLYEGAGDQTLADAVARARATAPDEVVLFVGSEGGFSPAEVQRFRAAGLPPATLGPRVLRVETACLALVAVVQFALGAMAPPDGSPAAGSPADGSPGDGAP